MRSIYCFNLPPDPLGASSKLSLFEFNIYNCFIYLRRLFHSDFVRTLALYPNGISNFIASVTGYPTSVCARTHFTVKSYVNSMLNTQFVCPAKVDGCVLRLTSRVGVSPATVSC